MPFSFPSKFVSIATAPLAGHVHAPGRWPTGSVALRHLQRLPKTAVARWAAHPLGQVAIDSRQPPRYEPGPFQWRHLDTHAVLVLTPDVVEHDARGFWEIVGGWLDHWLGCDAAAAGAWLSEGAAPTQAGPLLAAAADLQAILERGYAVVALETSEPRTLFARAVALIMTDPRSLSAADPHLARWLRLTLLDDGWWRRLPSLP